LANPQLADRRRPQRLGAARGLLQGQQNLRAGPRLPAGLGIAALPDYLVEENNRLVQLFGEPTRFKSIRISSIRRVRRSHAWQVFRDFVVSKAQRWLPRA